jgi:hypothetical protein
MSRQSNRLEPETKRVRLVDFEDYVKATKQLADLHTRRATRNEERATQALRLHEAGSQTRNQRLAAQAAMILSPDVGAESVVVSLSKMREQGAALDDEIAILDAAIRIQTNEVERLRGVHGGEVRDSVLPEHRRLVREIAELVVRLAQVSRAEYMLRVQVESEGAFLPPLGAPWVGSLTDHGSLVYRYLQECRERGYDVAEAIPQPEAHHAAA